MHCLLDTVLVDLHLLRVHSERAIKGEAVLLVSSSKAVSTECELQDKSLETHLLWSSQRHTLSKKPDRLEVLIEGNDDLGLFSLLYRVERSESWFEEGEAGSAGSGSKLVGKGVRTEGQRGGGRDTPTHDLDVVLFSHLEESCATTAALRLGARRVPEASEGWEGGRWADRLERRGTCNCRRLVG